MPLSAKILTIFRQKDLLQGCWHAISQDRLSYPTFVLGHSTYALRSVAHVYFLSLLQMFVLIKLDNVCLGSHFRGLCP